MAKLLDPSLADPHFLGGETTTGDPYLPHGLSDYYASQVQERPYRRQIDPYMETWAAQQKQQQLTDRSQQQQLMSQLQAQAQGAVTPQQRQQLQGFAQAQQNQQQVAQSAGGAYGRSAAMGGLIGSLGTQYGQNLQKQQELQAADQMSARQQMLGVSSAMRAQDLQALGMTAQEAARQAQIEAHARGMNYQQQLGMAGLYQQTNRMNQQAKLDADQRFWRLNKVNQDAQYAEAQGYMNAGMAAASYGGKAMGGMFG